MICHKTLVATLSKLRHILKKIGRVQKNRKKIGGVRILRNVRILRRSPNTSERPNTSEEPNTSDGTEYFGLKRFFYLLISHGTEVFANTSVGPNTSDPNTSESEYFGFYYSATIRPIPNPNAFVFESIGILSSEIEF